MSTRPCPLRLWRTRGVGTGLGLTQGSARQTMEDGIAHAKLQADVQSRLLMLQRDLLSHMREGSAEAHKRCDERGVRPGLLGFWCSSIN